MKNFYLFLLFFFFSYPSLANINQPYGLFFIQEDEQKEGKQIFEAPTLKTNIIVDVQGLISTTLVRQYFINPTKEHTEAVYLFPLPEKSAVDQLRMKVGDRYINGIIQEKDEAEETYQKAKNDGKKTSLVSSSRANIFKTKIANIEPGEMIIIEISFQDTLSFSNNEYSLRFPTVISHRYEKNSNNKIINESKILKLNPEIHSPINESAGYTVNPYNISINLNVGFDISFPKSNENLLINKLSNKHYEINLADGSMPSTKDFILTFEPIVSPEPYIQAYYEEFNGDLYIYGLINPQIQKSDLKLNKQSAITIIADVSGSMSGDSLDQMQSLLIDFINQFPEHHYINIIAFDDKHYKLFSKPKIASEFNKKIALDFVKNFNADNGTEMLPPIYEAIFEKTPLPNNHQIILMTDGAISYETQAIALVNEHIGNKRFHVVGIGNAPNSYLVKGLSKSGRGSFIYVDAFTFEEKTKELLFKINHPVIKNLRVFMENDHELLPVKLPDIIAGDPISFYMKVGNTKKEELIYPIKLAGNTSNGDKWLYEINKGDINEGSKINKLWAREKIDRIMFLNAIGALDVETYKRRIVKLALENNLVTNFTSLVAVDDQISRSSDETLNSFQLPQNLPEGWIDPNVLIPDKYSQKQMHLNDLNEVNLDKIPDLKIHFVQTDTNKKLYFIIAFMLFVSSFFLFHSKRII